MRTTQRGFKIHEFTDRYDNQCSIQESSLATEAAIWLGVDTTHEGVDCPTRMHLTREMAADLLPLLQYFVAHGVLPDRA